MTDFYNKPVKCFDKVFFPFYDEFYKKCFSNGQIDFIYGDGSVLVILNDGGMVIRKSTEVLKWPFTHKEKIFFILGSE